MNKTYMIKAEEVTRSWFIVDAADKVLGRLASRVATVLCGKHKTCFTPHVDCGDGVIVINAKKIRLTGRKSAQKTYKAYSGYPGGLRYKTYEDMITKKPEKVIRLAVKNMLPKTKLGYRMIKRLKVYTDDKHDQKAQNPKLMQV